MKFLTLAFVTLIATPYAHANSPVHCQLELRGDKFRNVAINVLGDADQLGAGCNEIALILDGPESDVAIALNGKAEPLGEGCEIGRIESLGRTFQVILEIPETDTGICEYIVRRKSGKSARVTIESTGT